MSQSSPQADAERRALGLWGAFIACVIVGILVWVTQPLLTQFPGAALPWPSHGLALVVLLLARPVDRVRVAIAVGLAVWVGAALGGGLPNRALVAAAMLVGQSIIVTLLYTRLARGAYPMAGTANYARVIAAILAGCVPIAVFAALVAAIAPTPMAQTYSAWAWWLAAVTSCATIVPIVLGAVCGDRRIVGARPLVGVEFAALVAVHAAVVAIAFLHVGPLGDRFPAILATLPFLAWAGLRFGTSGAAIISGVLTLGVLGAIVGEIGPFERFSADAVDRVRRAWIYLASIVGPAMVFPVALSERAKAERLARAAHAQLSWIVEASGELLAAVDRDLVILAANPAWIEEFERVSGVRAHPGMRIADAFERIPDERETSLGLWRRALAGERFVSTREFGDPRRVREEYEVSYAPVRDSHGEIVGASQIVRNITARHRQEAEEAEARRLESLGRLAGGVAHDFNNLMTAVMGYADLVLRSLPDDDPRRADMAEIERAAGRAGELTQQLLAFAQRRVVEPKLVDPAGLVDGFRRLLVPLVGPQVVLVVRSEPGLHRVRVDPTQFEQVVMNLAVNARDAMPNGGRLTIETENAEREDRRWVKLTVRDTGSGMTTDVQARLFEPFFTTKPLGQGTGLGLPTVHGIVHQAGGQIQVESAPGAGTTFHIWFPAAAQPAIMPSLDGPMPRGPHIL